MDIIIASVGAAIVLWLVVKALPYVYSYRVKNNQVQVVLFGFLPLIRVEIEDIDLVEKVSRKDVSVGGLDLRLGNMLFASEAIRIKKRSGLFRSLLITPRSSDDFIECIRRAKLSHPL